MSFSFVQIDLVVIGSWTIGATVSVIQDVITGRLPTEFVTLILINPPLSFQPGSYRRLLVPCSHHRCLHHGDYLCCRPWTRGVRFSRMHQIPIILSNAFCAPCGGICVYSFAVYAVPTISCRRMSPLRAEGDCVAKRYHLQ